MATDYIIGNDGFVTLAAPIQGINVKSWAANSSRVSSDVTGFSDTARRRRLGLYDIVGSLSGTPMMGTTTALITVTSAQTSAQLLVLGLYSNNSSVTTDDVSFSVTAVFDSMSFNSTKDGDATVQVSWQNASGAVPTVAWSVV